MGWGCVAVMLTPSDLAETPDFRLGRLAVSPSRRTVMLDDQQLTIEPRMMQVLVVIARDIGEVVTRQHLLDEVWGVPVGEDSLNRAVAGVRRALELDPGLSLETIPRTGYRLIVDGEEGAVSPDGPDPARRRLLIGAGLGGIAALAGGVALWPGGEPDKAEAVRLREQAQTIFREALVPRYPDALPLLERATRLDPDNAQGWGLLAWAYRLQVESGAPDVVTRSLAKTEQAARRALELDPSEGFALASRALIEPEFGQWARVEAKLLAALERAPDSVPILTGLGLIYQSVGRVTEGFTVNERATRLDPLAVTPAYRAALKEWILGKVEKADRSLARSTTLYPTHPIFWNTRITIYAFSGRPRAALNFMETAPRPDGASDEAVRRWRVICETLLAKPEERRRLWRDRLIEAVGSSKGFAVSGVMAFSAAGLLDDAFALAEGYYRGTGPYFRSFAGADQLPINDMTWRRTMMLFTPGCKAMRRDPRFADLCGYIGLNDYWAKTGTRPDPFLMA